MIRRKDRGGKVDILGDYGFDIFESINARNSDGVSVRAGEFGLSRMWQNGTSIRLLLDR